MNADNSLSCFKSYDVRGKLGKELNEDIAYRIGKAFVLVRDAKRVVLGGDIRRSSETLKKALYRGIIDAGADVIDIGMTGTEEIYFASFYLDVDGGIEVTASHNPIDYNGMKLVGRGAQPISGDSGLHAIRDLAETLTSPYADAFAAVGMIGGGHSERGQDGTGDASAAVDMTERCHSEHSRGISEKESGSSGSDNLAITDQRQYSRLRGNDAYSQQSILAPYVEHLLTYIDIQKIKPLRLVINAGNGAAGHVIDAIEEQFLAKNVPIKFIKVHHEPDGSFPNGIPNPLLLENRLATIEAIKQHHADVGIAWDGDFDRCFLFDENGRFIEGYYIVGLLAEVFLLKYPGEKIIHDPRLTWNTIDQVEAAGGHPIQSKTGHAFIKERMRLENAIYGGEMSAHHYFRDFAYCDSGMIPWLLVVELVSIKSIPMSELVDERIRQYPCSGEINFTVDDADAVMNRVIEHYAATMCSIDRTDGVSISFDDWRFNLRSSNTEPVLRLNLETRGDKELVKIKLSELERLIKT